MEQPRQTRMGEAASCGPADVLSVEPERPSPDEWWETWRERQWHRERPRVRDLLRENPFTPALYLIFLCVFAVGVFSTMNGDGFGLRLLFAVPLGVVSGTTVWWLFMLGFAKGWIEDE
jgi:hypothetical protein